MTLSAKFFKTISQWLPAKVSPERLRELQNLNPQKIYVENVRSILRVPNVVARRFCETAVRQGVFAKRVEVVCPDGSVAASAAAERDLPAVVRCWTDVNGEYEEREFRTEALPKTTFYQLQQ